MGKYRLYELDRTNPRYGFFGPPLHDWNTVYNAAVGNGSGLLSGGIDPSAGNWISYQPVIGRAGVLFPTTAIPASVNILGASFLFTQERHWSPDVGGGGLVYILKDPGLHFPEDLSDYGLLRNATVVRSGFNVPPTGFDRIPQVCSLSSGGIADISRIVNTAYALRQSKDLFNDDPYPTSYGFVITDLGSSGNLFMEKIPRINPIIRNLTSAVISGRIEEDPNTDIVPILEVDTDDTDDHTSLDVTLQYSLDSFTWIDAVSVNLLKLNTDISTTIPVDKYQTLYLRTRAVNHGGGTANTYYSPTDVSPGGIYPIPKTDPPSNIGPNTVTLNGEITNIGSSFFADVSFEWGPYPGGYPYTALGTPGQLLAVDLFSSILTTLAPNIQYHYRAKAASDIGMVFYGSETVFTTPAKPLILKKAYALGRHGL